MPGDENVFLISLFVISLALVNYNNLASCVNLPSKVVEIGFVSFCYKGGIKRGFNDTSSSQIIIIKKIE